MTGRPVKLVDRAGRVHFEGTDQAPGGGSRPFTSAWMDPFTVRWFDALEIVVTADSGTFTLTANGQTTAPIAFDASPDDIAAALQALSGIGADGVTVQQGSEYVFALGLLTAPVTADASGLVGVGAAVDLPAPTNVTTTWEVFTAVEDEIIENALCSRRTQFDVSTGARLTDDPDGTNGAPFWSAPYMSASTSGSYWDLAEGDTFTNFAASGDVDSASRGGARQVQYAFDADSSEWYVTLPTEVKADTPVYLAVKWLADPATMGEARFRVACAEPS